MMEKINSILTSNIVKKMGFFFFKRVQILLQISVANELRISTRKHTRHLIVHLKSIQRKRQIGCQFEERVKRPPRGEGEGG